MLETKFLDGFIVKNPHGNAPEFVVGKISIKVADAIKSLRENETNGWVNLDIKKSKQGKLYAQINEWKSDGKYIPKDKPVTDFDQSSSDDDLPF
jgi:hypothetical protein